MAAAWIAVLESHKDVICPISPESGLNNLSVQCQHASKAVTGIADIESKLDSLFHKTIPFLG
jgi:hypothetical protein